MSQAEAATAADVTSFAKALVLGEIHEELVFPFPLPDEAEAEKVRGLINAFRTYAAVMAAGFLIGVVGHITRSRTLILTGILIVGLVSAIFAFVVGKLT